MSIAQRYVGDAGEGTGDGQGQAKISHDQVRLDLFDKGSFRLHVLPHFRSGIKKLALRESFSKSSRGDGWKVYRFYVFIANQAGIGRTACKPNQVSGLLRPTSQH